VKVAVTSRGAETSSPIDPHFGRAHYFLVVDTDSGQVTVYSNRQRRRTPHTAGMQAAGTLIALGIEAALSSHIGPKAFATFYAAGVEVYRIDAGTVGEAFERFKAGKLQRLRKPNAPEHCPQTNNP
jgi:predicted Fe-Mo cluster-binding NifX family protein